jgi:dynein light chain LC8-type
MSGLGQLTPVVKTSDMSEDMQAEATALAVKKMRELGNVEQNVAVALRKEFEVKYGPTWHCIIGKRFGSFVTHQTGSFIYFLLGQTAFLLFKSA